MILSAPSLRNKLLLFSAMLVVGLGSLLGILAERNGRDSLERVIGRQLAREAEHTSELLAARIRNERETLESISRQDVMRQIRVTDLDKRIAQSLSTLVIGGEARVGYVVVDTRGSVVASSEPRWLLEPPDWAGARVESNTVIGLMPGLLGRSRLLTATPIADPDRPGARLGTLFGVLDWERLTDVTETVQSELAARGIAAEIAITDASGRLLRHVRSVREPAANARSPARTGIVPADGDGFRVDEEAGLIVGQAALSAGPLEWRLLVIEPLAHALAPARQLRNRIALTTGLVLLAALALAAYGARRVVKPLSELTNALREVSRGESASAFVPVRSADEVGTLARAFNKMIRDLDETQQHLVEAEKFALVGELAAGVAHEVRTSLGVLRSSAQIIERSLASDADDSVREMIGMIGAEVERLGRIVDDLLTLDHRRPLNIHPTALAGPLDAAIAFVERQAEEKGITIERRFGADDPIVACDPEAIQQVAVNLLSNAIASLEAGESIVVAIVSESAGRVRFEVRDTGRGVPPELVDRIFDPFVTGRESGVGLGLTFVKRVVHAHRGSVRLVSEPGAGACFCVALPRGEEPE